MYLSAVVIVHYIYCSYLLLVQNSEIGLLVSQVLWVIVQEVD